MPILETGPAPLLYIGRHEQVKIAQLRAAAEASPIPLADILLRQRLAVEGRSLPDPAACTILLSFGFRASYVIEEHPDGTWRRLTLTSSRGVIKQEHLDPLLADFGFTTILSASVHWRSRNARESSFSVSELIAARAEPKIVPLFSAPAEAEPAPAEPADDEEAADEC
jgi:hypothetical protein